MNSNHCRALTLRTLVAICLAALLIADSQAQTEAARKSDKDASGVDIVVQGALDSELQPGMGAEDIRFVIGRYGERLFGRRG